MKKSTVNPIQKKFFRTTDVVWFTTNQKKYLSEYLDDLVAQKKLSLKKFKHIPEIKRVLNNTNLSPRDKGEKIYQYIYALRYPKICQYKKVFQEKVKKIIPNDLADKLRIIPPENFEGNSLQIKINVAGTADLKKVLQSLSNHLDKFNQLFKLLNYF